MSSSSKGKGARKIAGVAGGTVPSPAAAVGEGVEVVVASGVATAPVGAAHPGRISCHVFS